MVLMYMRGKTLNNKFFIITVDTEGDAIWGKRRASAVTTENSKYIPRFQDLCEKYNFKPVYLTNYEMACDDKWVSYSCAKAKENKCEIGLHIHAWNTPPISDLQGTYNGLPYITEYSAEEIADKVDTMVSLLKNRYEMDILSHRSGRWATNDVYFDILSQNGIRIDCSFTPELDLSKLPGNTVSGGNDYRKVCKYTHTLKSGIIEVPMTTRNVRASLTGSLKHKIKTLLLGEPMWLRPISKSEKQLEFLTDIVQREKQTDYLEFMIHSSELMPGGSPYFKDSEDIEILYQTMDHYFEYVTKLGYNGCTLTEYVKGSTRL